jgi:aryl-alcohol dehydrogenase-like predicted oxidoreductase
MIMDSEFKDRIPLGKSGLLVSRLGIGAWSWGDRMFWSYGRTHRFEDVKAAYQSTLEAGINFIDTAESYGSGRSERILSELLPTTSNSVVLATKFMPFPWRLNGNSMKKALHASLERLNFHPIDLYQIHWPLPPISIESWANSLADLVNEGLVKAVGVSNYNEAEMRQAYATLAKRGIPLTSNQVEFSLLKRAVEYNGLLKTCQELGIALIAYSPLAKGALTGKYSSIKPMPGIRNALYPRSYLERIQQLIRKMKEIGLDHNGKSPAQVALNWCMCKGTIPIPGAKNLDQAMENSGALGWRLTDPEIDLLDKISDTLI